MNRRNVMTAAAFALPMAGCAALTKPVTPPSDNTDTAIRTAFNIAQSALIVLQFVPGLPPIVATEADAALRSLQLAYENYKNSPPGTTNAQAALKAAIDAAEAFLTNNGLPAAMATPAARRKSVRVIR